MERRSDDVAWVLITVGDSAKSNDKTRIIIAHRAGIFPNSLQIGGKLLRAAVVHLLCVRIINDAWPAYKPVSEPLIRDISAHSIIWGRRNNPIEGLALIAERCAQPTIA